MTFFEDIKSKHLTSYVLITIGDPIIHRISTQKVRLGEDYYKPILLNVPAISESLDVENRKYKISSVRLSISDYEEDGVRFSDSLNQLMNQEVNIYYASPSCKTLEECYLAGTFIVRSFTQDEDKVGLNCEDLSQDKLHKDLPLYTVSDDEEIPTKYHNKPYPLIFGAVENSPCVIDRNTAMQNEEDELVSGSFDIKYSYQRPINHISELEELYAQYTLMDENNPLTILNENNYIKALHVVDQNLIDMHEVVGANQYDILSTGFNLRFHAKTVKRGLLQVKYEGSPVGISVENNLVWANHPDIPATTITSDEYGILTNGFNALKDNGLHATFKQDMDTDGVNTDARFGFPATWSMKLPYVDAKSDKIYYKLIPDVNFRPTSHASSSKWAWGVGEGIDLAGYGTAGYLALRQMGDINDYATNQTNTEEVDFMLYKGSPDFGSAEGNTFPFPLSEIKYLQIYHGVAFDGSSFSELRINNLNIEIIYDIDNIFDREYYTSVIGKGGAEPPLHKIYEEILSEDVLNFDGYDSTLVEESSLGIYSFTLDKKISSKKLLEELSASSDLYPYFKNNTFNVKSIKPSYDTGTNKVIYADDVLSYKYDRTKIEKVYTRVSIQYHYDYGLKDFTKETGYISSLGGITSSYSPNYFGDDFDQELVFESKYIRDETTALNLAKYLFGLNANQHNLITVKLPLNYIDFELGNIVKFDKLIQGRKIFGEDYTRNILRNGQSIYPYFFVNQIKKNLDSVEIKLYQLHYFGEEAPLVGCMNITATEATYNPDATVHDESMCEYPEIITEYPDPPQLLGCLNPEQGTETAITYEPTANVHDESLCIYQAELEAPVISSLNDESPDEYIIPLEQEIEEVVEPPNLISDLEKNSTFDDNEAADIILLYQVLMISYAGNNPTQPYPYVKLEGISEEEFNNTEWIGLNVQVNPSSQNPDNNTIYGIINQANWGSDGYWNHYVIITAIVLSQTTPSNWDNNVVQDGTLMAFYPNDDIFVYSTGAGNESDWNIKSDGTYIEYNGVSLVGMVGSLRGELTENVGGSNNQSRMLFLNNYYMGFPTTFPVHQEYTLSAKIRIHNLHEDQSGSTRFELGFCKTSNYASISGSDSNLVGNLRFDVDDLNESGYTIIEGVAKTNPSYRYGIGLSISQGTLLSGAVIEIDDVSIREYAEPEVSEPSYHISPLKIDWQPSPNLLSPPIGETNINNTFYQIEIIDDDDEQIYISDPINPNINSYTIENIGEEGFPIFTSLSIRLEAISLLQHNEMFVFSNIAISTTVDTSWGGVLEYRLGDITRDGAVNVSDIVELIYFIHNPDILVGGYYAPEIYDPAENPLITPLELQSMLLGADVTEDGQINVIDIVELVYMIHHPELYEE